MVNPVMDLRWTRTCFKKMERRTHKRREQKIQEKRTNECMTRKSESRLILEVTSGGATRTYSFHPGTKVPPAGFAIAHVTHEAFYLRIYLPR